MLKFEELKENVKYYAVCSDGKRREAAYVNNYVPGGVVFCVHPDYVDIIGYELMEG